jgi:hypothetical protein
MYKRVVSGLTVVATGLMLAACSNVRPVTNIYNQPIPSNLSTQQVQKAFQTAGAARHWTITTPKAGTMRGDLQWRGYFASVNIPYDHNSYSIIYRDSANLKASQGYIARNYNKWVTLLNRDIQNQLRVTQAVSKS